MHVCEPEVLCEDLGTFSPSQGLTFSYTYQPTAATHSEAEAGCRDGQEGELVSVLSQEELDYVRTGLMGQEPAVTSVWIGGYCTSHLPYVLSSLHLSLTRFCEIKKIKVSLRSNNAFFSKHLMHIHTAFVVDPLLE